MPIKQKPVQYAVKDNSFYVLRERYDGEFSYCRVVDPERIGNHGCPHILGGRYMQPRAFNARCDSALSEETYQDLSQIHIASYKKHVRLEIEGDSKRFKNNVEIAKECSPYSTDSIEALSEKEYDKCTKILNRDGCCGCAVTPKGEIVSCFRHHSINHYSNVMCDLLISAREHGGKTLNCYSEELARTAEECGFECVARVPYKAKDLDGVKTNLKDTKPTLYVLKVRDESIEETIKHLRKKDRKVSTNAELKALPKMNKQMAKSYRDGLAFFGQMKGNENGSKTTQKAKNQY